ncbi:MAG: hypothetical protein N3E46_06635 [Gemmataceae bacterium]|nr:hypothetical protein [Gemmataceae bacterium]
MKSRNPMPLFIAGVMAQSLGLRPSIQRIIAHGWQGAPLPRLDILPSHP